MLVGEYPYTPLGILRPSGDTQLFRDDGRPTLLGESIADLFMIASLSGESFIVLLWGVKVSWSYSSAESTLYLEDRAACTVRTVLIAPVFAGDEGL